MSSNIKRKTPSHRSLSGVQAKSSVSTSFDTNIVSKKLHGSTRSTKISCFSHNCCELTSLIEQQRLTGCLELLEEVGYVGDSAVFVLALIQRGLA